MIRSGGGENDVERYNSIVELMGGIEPWRFHVSATIDICCCGYKLPAFVCYYFI